MKFNFKAKTETGDLKEGLVEAISREAAIEILQKNSLIPLQVVSDERGGFGGIVRGVQKLWEGASQKELMVIFRQLATLIEAHVPVVTSLKTISEQSENHFLRAVLHEMEDDIEDGMSFSESLEKHPTVFDAMTINLIRSGEVSGNLQRSIEFVADNIEKNYHLTSKVRGALFYPAFVLAVAGVIAFIVVTFILPKITLLIKDLNVPVPWYTTVLINLGDFMNAYWWAVLIALIAVAVTVYYYFRSESGKREWDIIVLHLPVFKTLAKNVYITRLADNLAALMAGGIPVVRALMITSDVIGNTVYAQIMLKAAEEVKTGGAMSGVFRHFPAEIPPIVAQMVKIGEETGTMSHVLEGIGKFYDQEVEVMTRNLTSLIEPILIVFLGIGVGILTVGVLMPIYNIAGQM
ncbi:MAG: type II secretion system F family protein [Candidatus Moraniibacteriota bacterium]|nr:MAG: type II secretion system F family protein [Candidatus Moranbacteria bacterium]